MPAAELVRPPLRPTDRLITARDQRVESLVVPTITQDGNIRLGDFHEDLSAIYEEIHEQYGHLNLTQRELPLGIAFPMYGLESGKKEQEYKVLSVDLQGLKATNMGLLVANIFGNPKRRFLESYTLHRRYLDNEFFPGAGQAITRVGTREAFAKSIQDPTTITTVSSLEGIYNFHGDYKELLQRLFKDGIRTIMPVHNDNNDLGTGHPNNPTEGLTSVGKEFVRQALDMGIAMDMSHASEKTSNDILDIIEEQIAAGKNPPRPLISHTGAYGHAAHTTRSASDKVIVRVAEMDGIIGIVPMKRCIAPDLENASIKDYVDTLFYVVELLQKHHIEDPIGHVVIGTDFNGMLTTSVTPGLDTIENFRPKLVEELHRRNVPQADQERILFLNGVKYMWHNLPAETNIAA